MIRRLALLFTLAFSLASGPGASAPSALPGDSVYHLDVALLDQDARALRFPALAGQVRVVSMFYASCPYVCPMIVDTIKRVEHAQSPAARARLHVLLVSLDPERDTPAALRTVADKRKLDTTRWTLARADTDDVRKLAALLGIQYRQLENREFNHSSALILLDAQGRVLARSSAIGTPDADFVRAVANALATR